MQYLYINKQMTRVLGFYITYDGG